MAVSLIQHTENTAAALNPSLNFASAVTAGDLLIACCAQQAASEPSTPTDNQSDTWLLMNGAVAPGLGLGMAGFLARGAVGGHKTSVTFPTSASSMFAIAEFSGTAPADPNGNKIGNSSNCGFVTDPTALQSNIYVANGGYALVYIVTQGTALTFDSANSTPGWTTLRSITSGNETFQMLGMASTAEQVVTAAWTTPGPITAVIAGFGISG